MIFKCSTRGYHDSLASGFVNHEKDFEKFFFKIFLKVVLATHVATHLLLTWVTKITYFAKIGLKMSSFSKLFIFPSTLLQSLCLLHLSLSQNHHFLPKTSKNLFKSLSKFNKMYGFSLYFTLFHGLYLLFHGLDGLRVIWFCVWKNMNM